MNPKSPKKLSSLKLVLDRFEENKAVLVEDEIEVILPKKCLPKDSNEGDSFVLTIKTDEEDRIMREKTAKDLLNELLSSEN